MPNLQVFDDFEESQKLQKKTPNWATEHWNRYVARALDKGMPYPSFSKFTEFVVDEAHIACNLISSLHALKKPKEVLRKFRNIWKPVH